MIAMIMCYEEFEARLNACITSVSHGKDFCYELLVTVVSNPCRYTGLFRLSNVKDKLIQNVTQSREIKFGDFVEDIITEYISHMGYTNLPKNIGNDAEGNALNADQVFTLGNTVYLIEQKIRDDHDSTKKRGQFANFQKKYILLKNQFNGYQINATMWFVDKNLIKNRKYYEECAKSETASGITINIFYGSELFSALFHRPDVWEEFTGHLLRNKQERSQELLTIPDFDTSEEMQEALRTLKIQKPRLFDKLISEDPVYIQLRAELFPTGYNLERVRLQE